MNTNNEKMIKEFKKPVSAESVMIGSDTEVDNIIMAIESSCDETACAIVKNGRTVLANVVSTQIKTHALYGGVVPEIAAREHLESINLVIEETFKQANMTAKDITAFAATVGPGLIGSLLVGLNAAKTLSLVWNKPFIGVNHLNAHVCANYIDSELKPPFIALLVSGGHSQIIKVDSYMKQEIIGETIDDSAGEAYDKVARLLGLPYPGGATLDKIAHEGNPKAYNFTDARVGEFSFSFSGLKTAVLRQVQKLSTECFELPKNDIAASFQERITATLLRKTLKAAEKFGYKTIVLAGGVAANSEIRKKFFDLRENGYEVHAPAMKYCTDNASMVAAAAYFLCNTFDDLETEVFSRVGVVHSA